MRATFIVLCNVVLAMGLSACVERPASATAQAGDEGERGAHLPAFVEPPATADPAGEWTLFKSTRVKGTDTVYLGVIVRFRDGQPILGDTEAGDSASERLLATTFRRGRTFHLFAGGRPAGTAVALGPEPEFCIGPSGKAVLVAPIVLPDSGDALATDSRTVAFRTGRRAPTEAEWRELRSIEDSVLRAKRIARGTRPSYGAHSGVAVLDDQGHPSLLVSTEELTIPGSAASDSGVALVTILSRHASGWRLAYSWVNRYDDKSREARDLLDVADLDGDGVPEIVMRSWYYESGDYTILRFRADRWEEWFQAGGWGC